MAQNENNFDIDGDIVHIGMPESPSIRFSFRLVILSFYAGRYLTEGVFKVVNQNISLLQGFALGDRVQINFQINDRKKIIEGKAVWYQNKEILNISKL